MQMLAEEETVNHVINELEKNFVLKPDLSVTLQPGFNLDQKIFGPALTSSLDMLKQRVGTIANQKDYQIQDGRLYLIGFKEEADQNLIQFVFPFGINIANILSNTIISGPKNTKWDQDRIKNELKAVFDDTVEHIVMQELFKFYRPDDKKVPSIPENILNQIKYNSLKNDDFNLVMVFVLPVDDLYEPLKKAIQKGDKTTNYSEISLAPLQSIIYNKDKHSVKLVTSLLA